MNRYRQELLEENPEALLLDEKYDSALVGVGRRCGQPALAIYDYEKLVAAFMAADGFEYEEAVEWVDFNVVDAWLGPQTPIWANLAPADADDTQEPGQVQA